LVEAKKCKELQFIICFEEIANNDKLLGLAKRAQAAKVKFLSLSEVTTMVR